jgi:3-hydroxyisobutyrate dehydrogenase-like beta-hydroxyacid dehydrogenase
VAVDVTAAVPPAVAVIGAGRMGSAMVRRLRAAEMSVVVFNRTSDKARALAAETGAVAVATAREAAGAAPVVLVSLADDQALEMAYGGPYGIIAGISAGAVVADTSTVDPRTVQRLGPQIAACGAAMLDAPVSGSVASVAAGELTVLAGGDTAHLEQVRPVLEALSRRIIHVGPLGAGATMKLAVNSIIHGLNAAVSEALVLAESAGVERSAAYEVFASSATAAPFVLYKRAAFERPEEAAVAFSLDLVGKDLDLILALAERTGAPMPQAEVNRRVVGEAVQAGYGGADLSALARLLRDRLPG